MRKQKLFFSLSQWQFSVWAFLAKIDVKFFLSLRAHSQTEKSIVTSQYSLACVRNLKKEKTAWQP